MDSQKCLFDTKFYFEVNFPTQNVFRCKNATSTEKYYFYTKNVIPTQKCSLDTIFLDRDEMFDSKCFSSTKMAFTHKNVVFHKGLKSAWYVRYNMCFRTQMLFRHRYGFSTKNGLLTPECFLTQKSLFRCKIFFLLAQKCN